MNSLSCKELDVIAFCMRLAYDQAGQSEIEAWFQGTVSCDRFFPLVNEILKKVEDHPH